MPLRNPGIRNLWIAQLVSITGDFLAIFAVLSHVSFRLHATPAEITGVSIAYMLPLALFGPAAGVLVDRSSPRRIMVASDILRAALVALLAVCGGLRQTYAILFAISSVSTFFLPAQAVQIRRTVPRDALAGVNAAMQQGVLIIRMASPAAAGALVSRFGPESCFYIDAVTFLFSAAMVWHTRLGLVVVAGQPGQGRHEKRGSMREYSMGMRFIAAHRGIAFVTATMAAATFAISCFTPLMAIFVRDILGASVRTFGLVSAMTGVGMMAGTQAARRLAGARQGVRRQPQAIIVFSLMVMSAGIVVLGASGSPAGAAAGAMVMGSGVGLLMVPAQTLIQSETPISLAGRVSSAVMSVISVAEILGLMVSGVAARGAGVRPLFFTSAAMLAALAWKGSGWKGYGERASGCAAPEAECYRRAA